MEKRKIVIIIIIVLVLILALLGAFVLITSLTKNVANIIDTSKVTPAPKPVVPTLEEVEKQNQVNYPDTIIGTIKFLDNKTAIKSTITTSDGKVYTLSPDQPKAIYGSFGIKDGNKVQIQGKIVGDKITWVSLKTIKE
jgi:predicted PurR-regulated permease PerM